MSQKIRLDMDEHVAKVVTKGLRQRGVDVLTVPESGLLSASDEEHLQLALEEGRVFFTHDVDFLRLHASGAKHAGIIFASQGMPIGDIIRGLMPIYELLEQKDMMGHVEFL